LQEQEKEIPRFSPLSGDFPLLFLAHFFFALALWPYALFPAHLERMGADPFEMGFVMGIAAFAGLLIRPLLGYILDRKGRRAILWIGSLIFLFTHLLYLPIDHLGGGLFWVRFLHGSGTGILTATFFTMAADLAPPSNQISGIALFGVSGQLGGIIGMPIAEKMVQMGGFPFLFIFCAAMSGISLLLCFFVHETARGEVPTEPFWRYAWEPRRRIPLLTTFVFAIGFSSYMVFLKPYAQSLGMDQVAHFFIAYAIAAIGVRLIGGNWPDRYGPKLALVMALLALSFGILLLAIIPNARGLIVSGFFCGMGHGFLVPILSVFVIGRGGESFRGGFITLYTMVFDAGFLFGSLLLGLIVKRFNYTAIYVTSAMLILISVFALIDFHWPARPKKG
jgi:predicted MFS family arabinose efflux permease